MKPVAEPEFCALLSAAGIRHRSGELFFATAPARTIVLHFADNEPHHYVLGAIGVILRIEDQWLLVPRFGTAVDLGLLADAVSARAVLFEPAERPALAEYLCTRPMDPGGFSCDQYFVSASGGVLVTWDHHTAEEGLTIQMQNVNAASTLLVSLNELGAELDLFYTNNGSVRF
jgi:hypothetical protein